MENIIEIQDLTKDFGQNRGIFGINLEIHKGEVFGLVGINGSGKSTIMRHLMGFLHPQKGKSNICGKDCWANAADIKKSVGYIPGEIAFPEVGHGTDFLKLQADYMDPSRAGRLQSMAYADELIERLNLDPTAKLKRMSKGMKQKSAIVAAFMCDSDILLLDEPTTGLDPLMQKAFTEIVQNEKKKGKTIFMSSHMFAEMEHTCDKVAFLKDGHILKVVDMNTLLGNEENKEYKVEFMKRLDYDKFLTCGFEVVRTQEEFNQVTIRIADSNVNRLFSVLQPMDLRFLTHKPYTLEACFKNIYNTEVA
jgi:ABC-2 type transport system ATP-binding protein